MRALFTPFALASVASSLTQLRTEEGAGDMLFALSSESEAQQAGGRVEDEYTSLGGLLAEAEALLQEQVMAGDREAADEEIALLQEVDADEKVAEEEMEADSDPEAPAAEAAPAAVDEAPAAEAAP